MCKQAVHIAFLLGLVTVAFVDVVRAQESRTSNTQTDARVVEVVAEGSGLSIEAAQKDAYRQAVRAVVGLYVDAKTIVENDELIEDRILSASNGFVKTARTIPGSAKQKNGIWRVRVYARVEVSEVSARLKKQNIVIRSLDGESL